MHLSGRMEIDDLMRKTRMFIVMFCGTSEDVIDVQSEGPNNLLESVRNPHDRPQRQRTMIVPFPARHEGGRWESVDLWARNNRTRSLDICARVFSRLPCWFREGRTSLQKPLFR
jgi:hypothetical protein